MEKEALDKKWFNYFSNMRNKYNMRVSANKPIVIFLDAKDSSKNQRNLLKSKKNGFFDAMKLTAQYFTNKYQCLSIWGTDELSFMIEDTGSFIASINNENSYRTHDIVSIFSQQFYQCFREKYTKNTPVYWHCKCSNIPKGKINSYIKYRSLTIFELRLTYFLKRKNYKDAGKISLAEKEKICNEMPEYRKIKEFEKGKLYISGQQVELEAFFNDKIEKVQEKERKEAIRFLDINNF